MGHWEFGLRFQHNGQRLVDGLAFDVPARQARQLENVVTGGRLGHLAKAKVQTLSQDYVQQADPVLARLACAQMCERIGEACCLVHVLKDVRYPYMGQTPVQIEHQIARIFRHIRFQTVDAQLAVIDDAVGKGAVSDRRCKLFQIVLQTAFAICQPSLRVQRDREFQHCLRRLERHHDFSGVAVTAGMCKPDVVGSECLLQTAHHRHGPQSFRVGIRLAQLVAPLGTGRQERQRM